MKVDCLLELTAEFFFAGDKAIIRELEDITCWQSNACEYDLVKEIELPKKETPEGDFEMLEPAYDCEFTEPTIGFTYQWVTEGRADHDYGCGIAFEVDHVGHDWFMDCHEDWTKDALEVRAELLAKPKPPLVLREPIDPNSLRRVRWLVAAGYWSSYDGYTGEHDGGVEVYGRVKLSEIQTLLKSSVRE